MMSELGRETVSAYAAAKGGLKTVSYTHLDVYKRQVIDHRYGELKAYLVQGGDNMGQVLGGCHQVYVICPLVCLLYTSRCV